MEQCPNCRKNAVEKDQCLACGIIISRWLKLHSVIPPEKSERDQDSNPVYPHVPSSIVMKKDQNASAGMDKSKTEGHEEDISGLKPPSFILEADATVPFQESIGSKKTPGSEPNASQQPELKPPASQYDSSPKPVVDKPKESPASEAKKNSSQPAFFAQTEADVIRLKRDLKTDWEDYYAKRKERYNSSSNEMNISTRFRIRNMIISVPLLVVAFFAADISFLMRFGITAEYSTLQPLISVIAIIAFFLALSAIITLKPPLPKREDSEEGRFKLPFHPVHIIEIVFIITLIILLPFKPSFTVDGKSEFPILSDKEMTSEFLTGEGLGNFIRPVFGRDGKTIYAIHLYGNSTGFLVSLSGEGSYKLIFNGAKITKYRLIGKNEIIYMDSEGLHRTSLNNTASTDDNAAIFQSERILPTFSPSDFDLSPDEGAILFSSGGDIWISSDPFTSAENLTKSPTFVDSMPSFFPDNNGFLYISDVLPFAAGDATMSIDTQEWYDEMAIPNLTKTAHCYQLFSYSFKERKSVRIIEDENNYYYPLYSPDMSKIAVVVEVQSNVTLQSGPLNMMERAAVLMKPDGSAKIRIFPPLEMPLRAMHEMCWSRDGKQLLLGINALLQKGIYRLSF